MTDKTTRIDISLQDVKELISANFEDIMVVEKDQKFNQLYDFKPNEKTGCYFSIKIPNNYEEGVAIHLTTGILLPSGDKRIVYPRKDKTGKQGRGHFTSQSIDRDKYWKKNLLLDARIGNEICKKIYIDPRPNNKFYNTLDIDEIYSLFDVKRKLTKERNQKINKCMKLKQQSSKQKCQSEIQELDDQIKQIQLKINRI